MARTKDILSLIGTSFAENETSVIALTALFAKLIHRVLAFSMYLIIIGILVMFDVKFKCNMWEFKLGAYMSAVIIYLIVVCRAVFSFLRTIEHDIKQTMDMREAMAERVSDNINNTLFQLTLPSIVHQAKAYTQPLYYDSRIKQISRTINMQYWIIGGIYLVSGIAALVKGLH